MHNDTVIGNKLISILHLRGLFDKLEKGVDTPIDNRFITLSGGEKQKITLMRALVHNPSIILLDEPTSALDKDSIDDLKKYLTSIKKNRIIIISTHDKNIVDLADVGIGPYNSLGRYSTDSHWSFAFFVCLLQPFRGVFCYRPSCRRTIMTARRAAPER